jgi:hypothetical protein
VKHNINPTEKLRKMTQKRETRKKGEKFIRHGGKNAQKYRLGQKTLEQSNQSVHLRRKNQKYYLTISWDMS